MPVLAAAPFNWPSLLSSQAEVPHFLAEFAPAAAGAAAGNAAAAAAAVPAAGGRFAGLTTDARRQQLTSEVTAIITNLLGTGAPWGAGSPVDDASSLLASIELQLTRPRALNSSSIDDTGVSPDTPLMEAGLDSLGSVELRNSLEAKLSVQLPPTLVFDYPSLSAIVSFLDSTLAEEAATAQAPAAPPAAAAGPMPAPALMQQQQVIAVVSTYGRPPEPPVLSAAAASGVWGPGGAVVLRDAISVVPDERWDVETRLTEDMPARFGGFIPAVQVRRDADAGAACRALASLTLCAPSSNLQPQEFDVAPFGMSSSEAVMVDPQQRLLLEATAAMLAGAGSVDSAALLGATGVFIGISNPDYGNIKMAATPIGVYSATGGLAQVVRLARGVPRPYRPPTHAHALTAAFSCPLPIAHTQDLPSAWLLAA
jgi:acyl carrier protein